jgi:hypothetical protein
MVVIMFEVTPGRLTLIIIAARAPHHEFYLSL